MRYKRGDTVIADIVVVNPEMRREVVIDSRLPAGLEAVDSSLVTTAPGWLRTSRRSGNYDHRELRDDRALFFVDELPAGIHNFRFIARATSLGRFVRPPTRAMEMYQPEVFGRTATTMLELR